MPPRESLRPATKAHVDEFVRIRATQAGRPVVAGGGAPIDVTDISWSAAPARRSRRRHPVADADDWGLADGDGWVVEPRSPSDRQSPDRPVSARHQARSGESRDLLDGVADAAVFEPDLGSLGDGDEIAVSRVDRAGTERAPSSPAAPVDIWADRPSPTGERRTIVITGRGDQRGMPRRRGWEASLPVYERSGFKPDRLALWAVLLGVLLLLVAATSSHAAILVTHLAR